MSTEKKTSPAPKRKRFRKVIRWGGVGVGVFAVFGLVSVEVTSQSWFCNSCHIMNPYYDSWTQDPNRQIKCTKCHIEPGTMSYVDAKLNGLGQVVDDLLARTSTKPSASVSQMSCLRSGCHLPENLGKVNARDLPYHFDHDKHLNQEHLGIAITCTTCHSHVQGDNHFEVNTNVCVTCHLYDQAKSWTTLQAAQPKPSSDGSATQLASADSAPGAVMPSAESGQPRQDCRACHDPPLETFEYRGMTVDHTEFLSYNASCESCHRNVTAQPEKVDDAKCLSCHIWGMEKAGETVDLHRTHIEGRHKVECFNCHGLISHGPDAQIMSLQQFDCQSCHEDEHTLQRSAYLSDPHADPADQRDPLINPMFLAHVDCNACHIQPQPINESSVAAGKVAVAVPEACDTCHKPGFGKMMVELWQSTTRELYNQTESLLPSERNPWGEGNAEAQRAIERAKEMLELVRLDGSWGVHNPKFTEQILDRARQILVEAGATRPPQESPEESQAE